MTYLLSPFQFIVNGLWLLVWAETYTPKDKVARPDVSALQSTAIVIDRLEVQQQLLNDDLRAQDTKAEYLALVISFLMFALVFWFVVFPSALVLVILGVLVVALWYALKGQQVGWHQFAQANLDAFWHQSTDAALRGHITDLVVVFEHNVLILNFKGQCIMYGQLCLRCSLLLMLALIWKYLAPYL